MILKRLDTECSSTEGSHLWCFILTVSIVSAATSSKYKVGRIRKVPEPGIGCQSAGYMKLLPNTLAQP